MTQSTAKSITFNTQNLINCITAPCNAASISKGIDILKFAKFEVKNINGTLTAKCTGNNGKCEVIGYDTAIKGDEITFLADARVLKDLATSYRHDKPITITLNENDIMLSQGRSRHSIETKNPDDYPAYDNQISGDTTTLKMNKKAMFFALERVCFASDEQGARPMFATVNIAVSQGEVTFTATDSYRLSQFRIPAQIKGLHDVNITIPRTVALQWLTLKDPQENIMLEFNQQRSRISVGKIMMNAQLYSDKYPIDSVNKIINLSFDREITVNTTDIKSAIQRIAIASDKAPDKTFIHIESTPKGEVKISPNKVVESNESIDAKTPTKDIIKTTYVLSQFSTIMSRITSTDITLKLNNQNIVLFEDHNHKSQPIILTPCDR